MVRGAAQEAEAGQAVEFGVGRSAAVLVALAGPDRDDLQVEVEVLDAQAEQFVEPQARTV
jgi:hypothetical protein